MSTAHDIEPIGGGIPAAAFEAAAELGEHHLRLISEAIPQQVWTATPDGALDYFNGRVLEYFGATLEQMLGWGWQRVVHPDDLPEAAQRWGHALRTGEPYETEFRLREAKGGAYRWHLARALPLRSADGAIVRWFGTNPDIDHQKESAIALQAAKQAAEEANRAKDRFLAVLSHELRTPLSPVLMMLTALETDPGLAASLRDDVAMMRRNVELEARLIDDLLDVSRVTTGKLRMNSHPARLHPLVEQVLGMLGAELHEKRLSVSTDLGAGSDLIRGDPGRLQQVLWNLLKNAVKFTPEGGRIHVATRTTGGGDGDDGDAGCGRIEVDVADTGKGISAAALPLIFDAFEQGEPAVTQTFGGLGLGLAIARAIVELHDGTIRAASDGPGRGATFTLTFPLAPPEPKAARPAASAPPVQAAGARIRVLLVDDHDDTTRTLSRLLQRFGYEVQSAANVRTALQLASAERFDVLVSDLGLPDASGYDLMATVRRDHGMKGIAVTGHGMEEDVQRCRDAGFAEHLVKPVRLDLLHQAIRRVTGAGER